MIATKYQDGGFQAPSDRFSHLPFFLFMLYPWLQLSSGVPCPDLQVFRELKHFMQQYEASTIQTERSLVFIGLAVFSIPQKSIFLIFQ